MADNKPKPISDTVKLEQAKTYKSEGNDRHKSKDFKHAIGKYHRALLQLKAIGQSKSSGLGSFLSEEDMEDMGYSSKVSPEMHSEVVKLMSDCYNNLAACLLQQESPNYTKVIEYCNLATELTPQNIKAYYRRGLGYYNLKDYDRALESFNQAASTAKDSKDQAFKALLNKQIVLCKDGIREQDKKLKEAYKGMFNRPGPAGET